MDNNSEIKHPEIIGRGYNGTLDTLAEDIGNLHYESLNKLLSAIATKLHVDAYCDAKRNRPKLAEQLFSASVSIYETSESIKRASEICKPFMK